MKKKLSSALRNMVIFNIRNLCLMKSDEQFGEKKIDQKLCAHKM